MTRNRNRNLEPKSPTAPEVDLGHIAQASPLLQLPIELRSRVITLVSSNITQEYHKKRKAYKKTAGGQSTYPSTPGFLLACKQLHAESIKIFYATATFSFLHLNRLRHWVHFLRYSNLQLASNVVLEGFPIYARWLLKERKDIGSIIWYRETPRHWTVIEETKE